MDYLQIQRAIIGGISMGAAIAQNFVLRYPDRVMGLVLSRPAWVDRPHPENVAVFSEIARAIRQHGAERGREMFIQSERHREIRREFANTADSLLTQFNHPRAEETVVKLERIPNDAPNRDLSDLSKIRVPTLVLANRSDPIHPFAYGQILTRAIPHAEFKELTSKSVSLEHHEREVQQFIEEFLKRHFSNAE
jgi:pimeloyl-ACP methyl ester carboxylesterase